MIRPIDQLRDAGPNAPGRRGAILIVVLALLTLFAIIGISFVYYADSEATAARTHREGQSTAKSVIPPDPGDAVNGFLAGLIFDADDNAGSGLNNALRGHSLLRAMYGWSGTTNTTAYNGVGTFHEVVDLSAYFNKPAGTVVVDRAQAVNYNAITFTAPGAAGGPTMFALDPENTGYRAGPMGGAFPGVSGSYVGRNAPYTYPDLKDFYLASVSPATGEVLVPSFHRPWLFGTLGSGNTNWIDPIGRTKILRPRPVDQLTSTEVTNAGVPYPIPVNLTPAQRGALTTLVATKQASGEIIAYPPFDPDNSTVSGDVQNLPGGSNAQRMDSVVLDVGLAPRLWNGKWVKPLVAALITDANGLLNVNIHGNVLNGGNHSSYAGYGPHEVNLGQVLTAAEANNIVNTRNGATPFFRGTPNVATRAYEPAGYPLPEYAKVAWGGVGGSVVLPGGGGANLFTTVPTFTGGYTGANPSVANHPSLFNPLQWPSTPGSSPRTYPFSDSRRLNMRYAANPDFVGLTDVAGQAPTGLGTNPAQAPYQPYPAATTPHWYRLDPAHPNRMLFTSYSFSLDRPLMQPNFLDASPARPAGPGNVPPAKGPTALQLPGGSLVPNNPSFAFAFPQPGSTTGVVTDFVNDWRNGRLAIGAVDLNRPLTDYRDLTTFPNVDGPGDPNPATMGDPTPQPLGPTNMGNQAQAWADRHNLARDIFARLIVATGAYATIYTADQLLTVGPGMPPVQIQVRAGDIQILASPGTPEYDALRYLAQLAANIVDYIDADDISTTFVWNPPNTYLPGGLPGYPLFLPLRQVSATDYFGNAAALPPVPPMLGAFNTTLGGNVQNQVVFGVEKPRLVVNEAYSELVNDPNEGGAGNKGNGKGKGAKFDGAARFWVELLNPTNTPYAAGVGPLGTGAARLRYGVALGDPPGTPTYSPYQLVIGKALLNPGAPNQKDFAGTLQQPGNVTGLLLDPSTGSPYAEIKFDFSTAGANNATVGPNGGLYDPAGNPASGIVLVGPTVKNAGAGQEFDPYNPPGNAPAPWTNMVQAPAPAAGKPVNAMEYGVPQKDLATSPTAPSSEYRRHVVLLRRLANPYLQANDPNEPGFVATSPANPFITVDYMDYVPANNAIFTSANGGTPMNQRFAVGKVQPYSAYAADDTPANDPPTYVFPRSFVLASTTTPANAPKNTFGRHNGNAAAPGPNGQTYTNFQPATGTPASLNPNETLMAPFDWFVHFDRPLANQLELLHAQGAKPHQVTQLFLQPDPAGTAFVRFAGVPPWTAPNNMTGFSRSLELLVARPRVYGTPVGGRVPGRININTVQDPRVLMALFDPQAGNSPQITNATVNNLWTNWVGWRTPGTTPRYDAAGNTYNVPTPGRTYDDDPAGGSDRPFKGFGVAEFAAPSNPPPPSGWWTAGGGANNGTPPPLPPGLNDTILRNSAGQPQLFATGTAHPYLAAEPARKVLNNLTTVSDTFLVWMTVVFHEVRVDAANNPITEPGTNRFLLGKEAYRDVPGDLRQKFFAVVDRSAAGLNPSTLAFASGVQPAFTSMEAGAASGATSITVADSNGFTAGSTIAVGVGFEMEVATISAVAGGTLTLSFTAPQTGFYRYHPPGTCVSNVVPGFAGPGSSAGFDRYNNPGSSFAPIVPLLAPIPKP